MKIFTMFKKEQGLKNQKLNWISWELFWDVFMILRLIELSPDLDMLQDVSHKNPAQEGQF
jgi:hypothetical protein